MKPLQIFLRYKITWLFLMMVFVSKIAVSQNDSTAMKQDSMKTGDKKKRKTSGFIIYGAGSINKMSMATNYESVSIPGWALGIAYRRGNFFYWQAGARYNNAIYEVHLTGALRDSVSDNIFSVQDIDIPITGGINLLSATRKILGT